MTIEKKKKAARRSPASLSSLDDLLKQDGKLKEFQTVAIEEAARDAAAKKRRKR